jgi:membrane-bound ClpP family serine protease
MRRPPPSRDALLRYAAFQMPGWGLAGALSFVAWEWFAVPAWAAWGAVGLWVAKDVVMARFMAHAYAGHARGGPHDLVGKHGVADTELAPEGTVRIRAERWRARCAPGAEPIPAGASVRVVEVEGLTAIVESAVQARG